MTESRKQYNAMLAEQMLWGLKSSEAGFMSSELCWSITWSWFGKHGIYVLDTSRVARISLLPGESGGSGHTAGQSFSGMRVEIINTSSGPIISQDFLFLDYISDVNSPRLIMSDAGLSWYDGERKARILSRPLCEPIEGFIRIIKDGIFDPPHGAPLHQSKPVRSESDDESDRIPIVVTDADAPVAANKL